MPERPELDYVQPRLHEALRGRTITAFTVKDPVVLRVAVQGDPRQLLPGRRITGVTRRTHFLLCNRSAPVCMRGGLTA